MTDVIHAQGLVKTYGSLSGQYAAVDEYLTGFENLDMIGRLYGLGRRGARERARQLLDRFELADAADRPAKTHSGGMRRRLDLAGALVASPPVLFLDEPTTGLDPRCRIDRFRSLPMARSAVLVGRTTSDVLNNVLVVVIMSLTGLAIGWRIRTSVGEALVGFVLLLLFAYPFSYKRAAAR